MFLGVARFERLVIATPEGCYESSGYSLIHPFPSNVKFVSMPVLCKDNLFNKINYDETINTFCGYKNQEKNVLKFPVI